MHVFIITFDQFKASLLNKSIHFYTFPPKNKIIRTPCFWMIVLQKLFISDLFFSQLFTFLPVVNYSFYKRIAAVS